jgi:hypothetical protein
MGESQPSPASLRMTPPQSEAMRAKIGPPMTLANMRLNGVRAVTATCEAYNHSADVNVDALPGSVHVTQVSRRLRSIQCGGKQINTRPAWHIAQRPGVPDFRPHEEP